MLRVKAMKKWSNEERKKQEIKNLNNKFSDYKRNNFLLPTSSNLFLIVKIVILSVNGQLSFSFDNFFFVFCEFSFWILRGGVFVRYDSVTRIQKTLFIILNLRIIPFWYQASISLVMNPKHSGLNRSRVNIRFVKVLDA